VRQLGFTKLLCILEAKMQPSKIWSSKSYSILTHPSPNTKPPSPNIPYLSSPHHPRPPNYFLKLSNSCNVGSARMTIKCSLRFGSKGTMWWGFDPFWVLMWLLTNLSTLAYLVTTKSKPLENGSFMAHLHKWHVPW